MTRKFSTLIACLAAGSCLAQTGGTVLVNTRLPEPEVLESGDVLELDLREHFQVYASPGPVATFTINMPELVDGDDPFLDYNGVRVQAYKLESGESYDNPYAVTADEYLWTEHQVEFQLLPEEAPVTVSNFMTYVSDGAYNETIVHRNESTGTVFQPGGASNFNPLPIVQSGGFRLFSGEDPDHPEKILESIETRSSIPLEQSLDNTKGTLAMARGQSANSATSQFFFNLEDNSNFFGDVYSVFGQLVDADGDQPVLDNFSNTPVYDLSSARPGGQPNYYPSLPFQTIPLYAPYPLKQSSYARISSVAIPEGDPDNVTYSYEWVDDDDEVSEEEAANRAAFDVSIENGILQISRPDTGLASIRIIGSGSGDQSANFEVFLVAFNRKALETFPVSNNSQIKQGGLLESSWYGNIYADTFPYLYHEFHGYQYVAESSTSNGLYIYDFNLSSWFYTSPTRYPDLYLYRISTWARYLEDEEGSQTPGSRLFWLWDPENRYAREDQI